MPFNWAGLDFDRRWNPSKMMWLNALRKECWERQIQVSTVADLLYFSGSLTDEELLGIRNIGKTALAWIRSKQAFHGRTVIPAVQRSAPYGRVC